MAYYSFSLYTIIFPLFSLAIRNPKYFTIVKHWRYLTPPQKVLRFSSLTDFSVKHRSTDESLERHKKICLATFINQINQNNISPFPRVTCFPLSHIPLHRPPPAFYSPIIRTTISSEPNTSYLGSSLNKDVL